MSIRKRGKRRTCSHVSTRINPSTGWTGRRSTGDFRRTPCRKSSPPSGSIIASSRSAREACSASEAARDAECDSASIATDLAQRIADHADQFVDLLFTDDERWRQRDDVSGGADQYTLFVATQKSLERALGGLAGLGFEFDSRHQSHVAYVDHMRHFAQRVHRIFEIGCEALGAFE